MFVVASWALAGCASQGGAAPAPTTVNAPTPAAGSPPDHTAAFARLASLEGDYEAGHDKQGRATVVAFRRIAAGTALEERWTWPSGAAELTVFFLDRDAAGRGILRATHYCHSGVQSTMTLQDPAPDGELVFRITSATGLASPEIAHNTGFGYRFTDVASVRRSEQWTDHGKVTQGDDDLVRRTP